MWMRYGSLVDISVLNEKELTETGMIKTANLANEWREIVKKSYTLPTYEIHGELDMDNFVYFRARAISAGEKYSCNGNGDYFPAEEIKKSIGTFVGKGFYIEHKSDDPDKAVGIIVSAKYLEPVDYAECIVAVSKKDAPDVCEELINHRLNAVSMGCFLAGTPVLLSDGVSVPIETVDEGSEVISHTGKNRVVTHAIKQHYSGDLYKVSVNGNGNATINATAEHPFYAIVKNKKCVCGCGSELPQKTNSSKRSFDRQYITGHHQNVKNSNPKAATALLEAVETKIEPKFVEVKELTVGDLLLCPVSCDIVDSGITEGQMKLIGYFLAEGNYLKRQGSVSAIQFNLNSNEEFTLAEDIINLIKKEFNIVAKKYFYTTRLSSMTVQACGKDLAQWFYKHCGEYSHGKKISYEVVQEDPKKQISLLAGWLNGDGHLHIDDTRKTLTECTTSPLLIEQLRYVAARCGIRTYVSVASQRENRMQAYTLGFSLPCSSELIKKTKWSSEKIDFGDPSIASKFDNYLTYPITNIEKEHYDGMVYNLEVADDNSYIAGGVSVHNCLCHEAQCSVCGNVAHNNDTLCMHMKPYLDAKGEIPNPSFIKGREVSAAVSVFSGIKAFNGRHVAYEINRKLIFNELSGVKKPADRDANIYTNTIIANKREEITMPGENLLDKLSYNDYKNLKKALAEDDDEFITKIAKKIKAEIGETVKKEEEKEAKKDEDKEKKGDDTPAKEEKKPEAAKVEPEKKAPEDAKGQMNKVKEEIKDLKEEIKEVKEEIKEVKVDVSEVSNEEKAEVKEEKKEGEEEAAEVPEEAGEDKLEMSDDELQKALDEINSGTEEGAPAEGAPAALSAEAPVPEASNLLPEAEGAPLAAAASQNSNIKEGNIMNLVYVPGSTFETSYFVASNDKGDKKALKASEVIPAAIQEKILKEATDVPKTEDVIANIVKACESSYDNFVKMASDKEGFSKKAYDFFAFKMENAPKSENGTEPIMALNEKEVASKEKATRSAPKTISTYYNRLPGSTVAEPEIALNLKSALDETTKTVESLKKIIAEKDATISKLSTDLDVVSKKVKAEDVSKVLEGVTVTDEDKTRLSEQLSTLSEPQLALVNQNGRRRS